jgi:hypothetical protein
MGWVVVGLILLFSALVGFQTEPAYAQAIENGTEKASSMADSLFDPPQNQLLSDQDSLIATPGLSAGDLSPSTQGSSNIRAEERIQQNPDTATSSDIGDEQSLKTGETVGNSIVQNDLSESVGEPLNHPRIGGNDGRDDTVDPEDQDQQSDDKGDEATNSGNSNDEDEDKEEDEGEEEDDRSNDGIPLEYRIVPFP